MSIPTELRYLLTPEQSLEIGKYSDDLTELQRYKEYRRLLMEQEHQRGITISPSRVA